MSDELLASSPSNVYFLVIFLLFFLFIWFGKSCSKAIAVFDGID